MAVQINEDATVILKKSVALTGNVRDSIVTYMKMLSDGQRRALRMVPVETGAKFMIDGIKLIVDVHHVNLDNNSVTITTTCNYEATEEKYGETINKLIAAGWVRDRTTKR